MSTAPGASISGATLGGLDPVSASTSEKHASMPGAMPRAAVSSTAVDPAAPTARTKLRSCVTCRTRKVRCDKNSPCSNCRRANIPCVFPSSDKPPRWARRLERVANSAKAVQDANPEVNQVMDRLRSLEGLVKELSSQLEQAHAANNDRSSPPANFSGNSGQDRKVDYHIESSSLSSKNTPNLNAQFGRLVLGDSGRSSYVSSGFWSRVNDELDGLKMDAEGLTGGDYDSCEDEDSPGKTPSSTQEVDRTPSERSAFLFRHNLSPLSPDIRELRPLPSQLPFLLNVYAESVNVMCQGVHIPTVAKMIRDLRGGDLSTLSPANEALIFAISYASVTSMDDDDVMTYFGCSKSELNLKYRLGVECALAKADFLNVPDITLLQAFVIFLFLLRRHDSPRFIWMMTGLAIRMAQALGLNRDGSRFSHLTPYEIEMRRRMWWCVCALDIRAAENQGTDLTITHGSFDTQMPLNINDTDLSPETKEIPEEREGMTDMTFTLVTMGQCDLTQQMMAISLKDGAPRLEEQNRLLNEFDKRLERIYLRYADATDNITYWVAVTIARLVVSKMSLIIYFPVLFSSPSPSQHASDEIRAKLLVAAIEVAEYNHALNAENRCRQWRWIFQTYTHWYAVVYLLIEAARRPWSPALERAWVALHSVWLIPARSDAEKGGQRIWVPLRKLMAKARRHRDEELERLRADTQAARQLEIEDRYAPQPASQGPLPGSDSAESFRERWRRLVGLPSVSDSQITEQPSASGPSVLSDFTHPSVGVIAPSCNSIPVYSSDVRRGSEYTSIQPSASHNNGFPVSTSNISIGPQLGVDPSGPADLSDMRSLGAGFGAWLWADADSSVEMFADLDTEAAGLNVDSDGDIDWNNWVESATGMERSDGQLPAT
ncbi:fungal-specific transcription factor domain-containing protein [Hypoxylon trugodes]|uniref:fungal-specific transcription factor domain-containing protein n=1 Tax=Hypoxylon trugodes TaxID=326681 RepID=UPI0021A0A951|nr:fungal-specific transcription factor domain-containing protein [Hypoxylon trugodes]KAI1389584.1 fungal-specific transcription factor domain-containing protein [Hypoxylon trugodes]